MQNLTFTVASTSKRIQVFIADNSTLSGTTGLAGLTDATANLRAYYIKDGAATATAITLAAGTVGTWSSGGFKEIDATNMPGWYELGIPNLALSTGTNTVITLGGATNMAETSVNIALEAINRQDAVRAGLTALPNVAAGANGGLPTGNASAQVVAASVVGNVAGNVVGTVASVVGAVGSVTGDVGGNVTGSVGSLSATALDAMLTDITDDADGRSSGIKMLRALFNRFYNAVTQTATTQIVKNDSAAAVSTMTCSDNGTTTTKGKSA